MPRRMSHEREIEYAELRGYMDYFSTHIYGIDPKDPTHPTNAIDRAVAAVGKSRALDGLKQAINDTVEALEDLTPESILSLDMSLREKGLITASEVRRRYSAAYKRIIRRGEIRDNDEYYIIAGLLADVSLESNDYERENLEEMVASYELST